MTFNPQVAMGACSVIPILILGCPLRKPILTSPSRKARLMRYWDRTLAEFTLNSNGLDFYDVSLVDGYNLPMSITSDQG